MYAGKVISNWHLSFVKIKLISVSCSLGYKFLLEPEHVDAIKLRVPFQ